ncbi:myo-inosose-2 dehydratase [Halomonas heilongjiangensis]|uniref:Myo-inosose-2 dehydratase n=1 Tax=Halomonas heilongjiangensis TaxID=1387883 RepID=A0A2N7TK95_9GAMM|nr:myo-inosose-2 dehydratase [Halomonas heilongjiangensis]PMR68613.1 myo-inosose-2 dehydratase [Halomonas heilongjiangensis]PXX89186.1 myo-inosose-2 dehydratase [Halomonas heilongjiangensis]
MSVRLGINPLTWTNDDMPSLGGDTPLEVCLAEGKQAGFSGFELGHKFPRDPAVLGPILESHGLALVSGWYSSELLTRSAEEEIEALKPHLHLLKSLGATAMVFCEVTHCVHGQRDVPLSHSPTMSEAKWQRFLPRLNEVADYCQEQGVQIAYHHHLGTVIETEEEIDRLMAGTRPSVGLLLDSGHLVGAGGDPLAVQQKYAERINHVHCKDIRREVLADVRNRDLSFLEGVLNGMFTVPGDGYIDYTSLFRQLAASDYAGWLVVEAEQDPAVAHPLTYARLGRDNLKRFCAEAGLTVTE